MRGSSLAIALAPIQFPANCYWAVHYSACCGN